MSNAEFERELELVVGNETVKLHAVQLIEGDVGVVVWDSAILTAKYFEAKAAKHMPYFKSKTVLELGAGVGMCGIALALFGAETTLTDLPDQLDLLRKNVKRNSDILNKCEYEPRILELEWGKECEASNKVYDFVIMVDCLYYSQSIPPLIATLLNVTNSQSIVICVYEKRDIGCPVLAQKEFIEKASIYFDMTPIPTCDLHPDYIAHDIVSIVLKKKTNIL